MNKKHFLSKDLIFIFVIIISSFVIRWHDISSLPYGLEGDELSWISTSLFHKFNILASDKGLWSMHDTLALATPVTIKINQLSFLLFGTDIISARKMLAILSVFLVTTFYLLCRRFFKALTSFLITMIYSLSAIKLITSRIVMGPSYSDLFLYATIFFLLLISKKRNYYNYSLALLGGLFTTLSLFIYNLAYWLPILGITIIIYKFYKEKILIRKIIIILLIFLLPIIVTFSKWYTNIREEQNRKKYALSHVVLDIKKRQINLNNLNNNVDTTFNQLVRGLRYETSDMLVKYHSTIIPLPIVILAIIGLLFTLINLKKYFVILMWLILSFLPIILFGLYLPRMWINTIGAFYMLAAIPVNYIWIWASKKNIIKYLFFIILLFGSVLIINLEVNIFFLQMVKNPSFSVKYRDTFELAKKYQKQLINETVFISDSEFFGNELLYPATTFYYLAAYPEKFEQIKQLNRKDMKIFTKEEFRKYFKEKLINYKIFVVDNLFFEEVITFFTINALTPKKVIIGNSYSEFEI